jgi:SNF family Na+-dependent transporter
VRCSEEYGTQNCFSKTENDACNQTLEIFWDFKCTPVEEYCKANNYTSKPTNLTVCFNMDEGIPLSDVVRRVASTEEYFKRYILGLTSIGVENTWDQYGSPQWKMIGCLALSWLLIACSLIKGVASYGKLSYFITLFPYVVLTTFLIYVAQQDGFSDGIRFYTQPDWNKVLDVKVWIAACVQIFFSLGVSVGSQLLLCSYNKFNNNVHRDAWLIGLGNSVTSIFAGFVVFGTLGMLAHDNNVAVEDVVTEGTGLAFQAYPEALAIMYPGPLFSFLFFFMLCLLAMSSVSGSWEPVVAAIFDDLPALRKHKSAVYFGACLFGFLGGVSCCFPSGHFMFNMLNDRISNAVTYLAFLEITVMAWFYGVNRFMKNIGETDYLFDYFILFLYGHGLREASITKLIFL